MIHTHVDRPPFGISQRQKFSGPTNIRDFSTGSGSYIRDSRMGQAALLLLACCAAVACARVSVKYRCKLNNDPNPTTLQKYDTSFKGYRADVLNVHVVSVSVIIARIHLA
jgi:hypothetical protein